MRLGRSLLTGTGWAGTIGGLALCVLVFLALYVAAAGRPDDGRVVKLPSRSRGLVSRSTLQDAALRLLPPLDPPPRVRAGVATVAR